MKVKKGKKIKDILLLLAMRQASVGLENPALFFSPPIAIGSRLVDGSNLKKIKRSLKRSLKGEKSKKSPEELMKKVVTNFVLNHHMSEGDSNEVLKERVKFFLAKSIGPDEKGRVAVFDQGEVLTITPEGNILGPS